VKFFSIYLILPVTLGSAFTQLLTEMRMRSRKINISGEQSRSGHVGFVVGKAALGYVFIEYFGCPFLSFHRLLHTYHHPSSGAGTIGQ
jgi:hypothetical protein